MDAGELHKLAKVLRQIAIQATSDAGEQVSATEALVGMDVFTYSPTTVTDITKRTGVVQSQVSTIVADMLGMGVIDARKDPADGRRTLLTVTPRARSIYGTARGSRHPRAAIKQYLSDHGKPHADADVEQVVAVVEQAWRLLGDGA